MLSGIPQFLIGILGCSLLAIRELENRRSYELMNAWKDDIDSHLNQPKASAAVVSRPMQLSELNVGIRNCFISIGKLRNCFTGVDDIIRHNEETRVRISKKSMAVVGALLQEAHVLCTSAFMALKSCEGKLRMMT